MKFTWKEYSNKLSITDADYILLIGYLKYCREKGYNPVDREKVAERLAFIQSEISGEFIELYKDYSEEIRRKDK